MLDVIDMLYSPSLFCATALSVVCTGLSDHLLEPMYQFGVPLPALMISLHISRPLLRYLTKCLCSLVLQLRVEKIPAADGRDVEAVPPEVAERCAET